MNFLFLITARGGSKGILKKNIKHLCGKPLISYTVEIARQFVTDEHICVSTDDNEIIEEVEKLKLKVPFVRPSNLATDNAGSNEVIMHALNFYIKKNINYDGIVLLQPTSPLRLKKQITEALAKFSKSIDMLVSVKETKSNPYNLLFETNENGYLKKVINSQNYSRRQDAPTVYEVNGAIYIYNITSLIEKSITEFEKKMPYIMPNENSVDIDTMVDWYWAEFLLEKNIVKLDY